jgi:hypothetical protein
MDRPVDGVEELWVTISEMWLKPAGDGRAVKLKMVSSPITVNLLEHNDLNASVLVENAVVEARSYNWFEMVIEDDDVTESFAKMEGGGTEHVDVDVPGGRLRLVSGFDVEPNGAIRILFDWDVRKGLTEAVGQSRFMLRPAFRVLNVDTYGAISGVVALTTIQNESTATGTCTDVEPGGQDNVVVYVFDGDQQGVDLNASNLEPITSVDAAYDPNTTGYNYRVAVDADTYPAEFTVAFACEGSETVTPEFLGPVLVEITDEATVETVNF